MNPIKTILFDLDGTLLNTNKLILESFKYSFRKRPDLVMPDELMFYSFFGRPLKEAYEIMTPGKSSSMIALFREYNLSHHDEMVTLFPGVAETIPQLAEQGYQLAIVTSKMKKTVLRGLNLFDLEKYFSAIVAEEDTINHKPLPEPVFKALDLLDCKADRALMIGDSVSDIASARNARVASVLVAWSNLPEDQLIKARPDFYLSTMSLNHIEQIITQLNQRSNQA